MANKLFKVASFFEDIISESNLKNKFIPFVTKVSARRSLRKKIEEVKDNPDYDTIPYGAYNDIVERKEKYKNENENIDDPLPKTKKPKTLPGGLIDEIDDFEDPRFGDLREDEDFEESDEEFIDWADPDPSERNLFEPDENPLWKEQDETKPIAPSKPKSSDDEEDEDGEVGEEFEHNWDDLDNDSFDSLASFMINRIKKAAKSEPGSLFDDPESVDDDSDDEDFDPGEDEDELPLSDEDDDSFGVRINSLDELDTGTLFETPARNMKDEFDETADELDLMEGEDGELIQNMDPPLDEDLSLEDGDFEDSDDDEIIV